MKHLLSLMRRAVEDYKMINEGDRICVGVSGGKDSLSALYLMSRLKDFYPKKFSLCAVTIDMGFSGADFSPVAELCERLGVEYHVKKTEIGPIIFDVRKEQNPCSLCAKMRRGSLGDAALSLGCNRVALGHHLDDVVETFYMSLFYEGRLHCFSPVTYLSRTDIYQIRPLIYIPEKNLAAFAGDLPLPVLHNPCPANRHTKREYIKEHIATLSIDNPAIKQRIFGALQRSKIEGWENPRPFIPFVPSKDRHFSASDKLNLDKSDSLRDNTD